MRLRLVVLLGTVVFLSLILVTVYPSFSTVKRSIVEDAASAIRRNHRLTQWNRLIHRYLKMPLDHHYGSHAIVLLAAAHVCPSGPILELGMGTTSTTLLSRLAKDQRRLVVSADSDLRWINYFSSLSPNNTFHQFKHVEIKTEMGVEWAMANLEDMERWTIVFIDHRPGARRKFDLMSYAHRSDLVILHDTEQTSMYQYHEGLTFYPYQYRFTKLKTFTDILSTRNQTIIEQIRDLLQATNIFANGSIGEMF